VKTLRAINRFSDRHPILSIAFAVSALFIFAMIMLPPDPPYVDAAAHHKGQV
jgi:hypothetical protein